MRQAGRSLPEYRQIRERHAFFEINRSAELTAEVTLQPVRRHDVDAAVMFADIMTPVVAMGLDVELVEGVGPVLADPVRTPDAVERLDVPTIHFGTGTATILDKLAAAGGDAIGLDWRIPLDQGWARVGERAVQGNLDPAVLLAPWERVEAAVRDVLARAEGRPGHIFNLGHGVLPGTDPDVLGRVRELVHAETADGAIADLWTKSSTLGAPG